MRFYSRSGPQGNSQPIREARPSERIQIATQLEKESRFDNADAWQIYCSEDPNGAVDALLARHLNQTDWSGRWTSALSGLTAKARNVGQSGAEREDVNLVVQKVFRHFWNRPSTQLLSVLWYIVELWLVARSTNIPLALRWWNRLWHLSELEKDAERQDSNTYTNGFRLIGDAINSAGGKLALAEVKQLDKTWDGLSKPAKALCAKRLARMIGSRTRAGLHVRSQLVEHIYWVQLRLPKLVDAHLIPALKRPDAEGALLRDILACYTTNSSIGFRLKLRDELLRGVKDHRGTGTSAFNAASRVVWEMLYAHSPNARVRSRLSTLEARRILRESSLNVRNQTLAVLARWLRSSKIEEREKLWRDQYGPTFKDLWLLDHRFQNEETSKDLAELCVAAGHEFPNALDAVLPFMIPLESDKWPTFHYLRPEGAGDLLHKFPREVLKLLWALLRPPAAGRCADLPIIVDELKRSDPTIADDRRFQWLLDREARY